MLCMLAGAREDPGGVSNAASHESGCEPADPAGRQQHHQEQGHHRAQDATPQLQCLISDEYQNRFTGEVSAVIPYQEGEKTWRSRPPFNISVPDIRGLAENTGTSLDLGHLPEKFTAAAAACPFRAHSLHRHAICRRVGCQNIKPLRCHQLSQECRKQGCICLFG